MQMFYQKSPDIERRKKLANAMMKQGMDGSPVGHWTQALGRVANAYVGKRNLKNIESEEADKKKAMLDSLAQYLNPNQQKDPDPGFSGQLDIIEDSNDLPPINAMEEGGFAGNIDPRRQKLAQMMADPQLREFAAPYAMQMMLEKPTQEKGAQPVKAADGYLYNPETRERWFPDVVKPEPTQSNEGSYYGSPLYKARGDGTYDAYAYDKNGTLKKVAEGVARPIKTIDLGDRTEVIDNSGAPVNSFEQGIDPKEMPDHKAAVKTAEQQAINDVKKQSAKVKTETTLSGKSAKTGMMKNMISEAKDKASWWTTGFVGNAASYIPGTDAHDLSKALDTIKANIGFDRLQEMRDSSPTGGALGQVSEMENRLLQAVWGNLEQSQSKEQFIQNLDLVEKQVEESWERIARAYEQDYGQPYVEPQSAPQANNDPLGVR